MTEERAREIWDIIRQVAIRTYNELRRLFRLVVTAMKNAFINYCLARRELRTKAVIYLKTKNRRIKRKQFKRLIKTVFGG